MRRKVLIISNVTAGLVSFRIELIETLIKDYDVFVLAADTGRVEQLKATGATVILHSIDRHGTNPITEIKNVAYYKNQIKKINPSVILTYTIKPNIYAGIAAASLNIPYIANITGLGPALENDGVLKTVTTPLYRYGLRKAQRVFFQNESNRDFMIRHHIVKKGQCDLLPGSGVNLKKYTVQPYPDSETIDFAFISRIVKEKGIDQYLEAAKTIKERHPETRFHIYGACEGQYEEILKRLEDSGVIIYHGRVDDILSVHRMCACTIHPSYYPEGMSNVLLEACACGRPIITTDKPGCKEIIDDGMNGFLVKQKDSADLVDKIECFLKLDTAQRKGMGLAGRDKVETFFNREQVVKKYICEIERIRRD